MPLSYNVRTRGSSITGTGGGGSGGSETPDIVWDDTIHFDGDQMAPKFQPPADVLHFDGDIAIANPKLPDTLHFDGDTYTATVAATESKSDTIHWPELTRGRVINIKTDRTGTPDTDMQGDGWVDSTVGNTGINHGNESPLLVSDENIIPAVTRRGLLKWDLTRFANLSAPTGGTMDFSIWGDTNIAIVAQTVEFEFSQSAASPFTESTLTWANQPAVGGNAVTKSFAALLRTNVLVPEYQEYAISLTAAEYGPYLGKWLMCRVTSATLVAVGLYNVASREHTEGGGAGGLRPRLSFDWIRN